ncbi:hypothetical protein Q428_04970 [Fervidicella metallireducens AeB]|uniref:Uncharacterized protein n=1 Tax=Fervidicella metallireducens AeB TaxID=1403537 RepID=A0A017RXB0_9CLOT|nr:hypothetical protein [Fervidicella metallireducens]EYE89024.1 hypothetical protein Q428_04970 [Fervidicella metallireducens AeB]
MKGRIINKNHEYYDSVINVEFLNSELIAGRVSDNGEIVAAEFNEVEFIFEARWEEKLIKNRDILNIRKPKEASYYMYKVLIQSIEEHLGEEIERVSVVSDKNSSSRDVWIKDIRIVVNSRILYISMTGVRYENVFDVRIKDLNKEEFIEECTEKLNEMTNGLSKYIKRINGLKQTIQMLKYDKITNNIQITS